MNPLLIEALGSIVRWAFAIGAGYLVQHGIWTQEAAAQYVAAAALAVVALGWSLWQKYRSRLKLVTALSIAYRTTETGIEKRIESGLTPAVTTPKDKVPTI